MDQYDTDLTGIQAFRLGGKGEGLFSSPGDSSMRLAGDHAGPIARCGQWRSAWEHGATESFSPILKNTSKLPS